MNNNIDYERLRKDLIDYFGTAISFYSIAMIDISKIETATNNELINIAINNGFDLTNYQILKKSNKLNRDLY